MSYPKISSKRGELENAELNQLLLNAAVGEMQEVLGFCGLEDCVIIAKMIIQLCDGKEPFHNVAFYLASSPEAEKFCRFDDGEPQYSEDDMQIILEDRDGDFCRYGSETGLLQQTAGRFLVRNCLFYRAGEEPNEEGVRKVGELAEKLFAICWDWLTRPGRSANLYAIKFEI